MTKESGSVRDYIATAGGGRLPGRGPGFFCQRIAECGWARAQLAQAAFDFSCSGCESSRSQRRERMSKTIETRRFEKPDQVLDMKAKGRISIIKMADGTTGMHAIFEPGWVWEVDEKPLLGNPPSCPMHHTGYCIAGRLVVRMVETNVATNIGPGDFFEIPAGHDAYVDGNERVELVLFAPPEHRH